ncbi:unnamed protein product [Bursaphelenchus xylophilus]|uniref:(pine wood nematode) hypothetical protein n=1 Tax=Bursaphelenchus xylophilus TaxID=6326 RepID=A0A7I8WNP0_BURXY|nr:unnamed protein product [Bursaphelenchus xylophilus]CAG9093698.1 unnamed protein product [Bursaphelenchus xylophilus]
MACRPARAENLGQARRPGGFRPARPVLNLLRPGTYDQRLPRLRSRLLAPALSGSGSAPGARAGAGIFGCGSGS